MIVYQKEVHWMKCSALYSTAPSLPIGFPLNCALLWPHYSALHSCAQHCAQHCAQRGTAWCCSAAPLCTGAKLPTIGTALDRLALTAAVVGNSATLWRCGAAMKVHLYIKHGSLYGGMICLACTLYDSISPFHFRGKRQAPYMIFPEILVIVDYDGYR